MNENQDYPYKSDTPAWVYLLLALGIISLFLLGIVSLIKWMILPNLIAIINWFVPNFWNMFLGIIIVWVLFKIASFIWYPIYSLLGKYSYLILVATLIYIFMQIS